MLPVPPILTHWLGPFAPFFTKPTWDRVLVLVTGTVLAPGRRTVTAVLSVLGRRDRTDFARFHGVLNRALLRDNQNHARCDNQASLMPVNVVQCKLHPGIMMSGRQAD